MAGLFTALACIPQCEDVVVIEPDEGATEECTVGTREGPHGLKVHSCTRKRVMQTFGFHGTPLSPLPPNIDRRYFDVAYQPFILLALKRWFPDFEAHVLALGGTIKPWDVSHYLSGLVYGNPAYIQPEARCLPKHPNIPSGKVPHSLYLSRVRFEPLLRRLVKQRYPGVRFIKGTVMGVVLDATKTRVTSIEYTAEKGERVSLECALFVDCAGMARTGVKWLYKAGLPSPKVVTYNANMRYGFSECFQDFVAPKVGYIDNSFSLFACTTICQGQTSYPWRN
jgi:Tryptophan halogenase